MFTLTATATDNISSITLNDVTNLNYTSLAAGTLLGSYNNISISTVNISSNYYFITNSTTSFTAIPATSSDRIIVIRGVASDNKMTLLAVTLYFN